MIVFGAAILALGAFLVVSHRRRASAPASIHDDPNSHKLHSVATAVAVLASVAWTFTGAATAQADTLEPGLPEFCYEDPTLTVAKNDPGDDQHEVEPGISNITVAVTNTSDEALEGFTFDDVTEFGPEAVFAQNDLDALESAVLEPGETLTINGTVEINEGETHRNEVAITAVGAVSAKEAESSDPTTLIGPDGPEFVVPAAPELETSEICDVESTVTIAETQGVEYTETREGNVVTIVAEAADGFVIADDASTSWEFDVTAEECEVPVVSTTEPDVVLQCDSEPTVTIPEVEGLLYTTARDGDQLIVTATAQDGYELDEDQQTTWYIDMTYDTSQWDNEAWGIEDPAGYWTTIGQRHSYENMHTTVEAVTPLNVPTQFDLFPEYPDGHAIDWISQAQDAGATITIGKPKVEVSSQSGPQSQWTAVDVEAPRLVVAPSDPNAQDEALHVAHFVPEDSDFIWSEFEASGKQLNRLYTWPVEVSMDSPKGTCTQTMVIEVQAMTPKPIF